MCSTKLLNRFVIPSAAKESVFFVISTKRSAWRNLRAASEHGMQTSYHSLEIPDVVNAAHAEREHHVVPRTAPHPFHTVGGVLYLEGIVL